MRALVTLHAEIEKRLARTDEDSAWLLDVLCNSLSRAELRALAADPSTHPEMLVSMVSHVRQGIRKVALRNPNLPVECLLLYAAAEPRAVLANPMLALQLLEDPSFGERFSSSDLQALLRTHQRLPWAWRVWARYRPWMGPQFREELRPLPRPPSEFIVAGLTSLVELIQLVTNIDSDNHVDHYEGDLLSVLERNKRLLEEL